MRRQHGYTLIEMLFVIGFCFLLLLLTSFIFTSPDLMDMNHVICRSALRVLLSHRRESLLIDLKQAWLNIRGLSMWLQ